MDISTINIIQYFDSLNDEEQHWLAHAIAGMISADGVVDSNEIEFLQQTVDFLRNPKDTQDVLEMVRKKKNPILSNLEIDRKKAFELLKTLAHLSIIDKELKHGEIEFFKYASCRLGFNDNFCRIIS